jgi:predicted GIY-YIG superfamily endonuclease
MAIKAANTNIMAKQPYVCIRASQSRGALYIGVTSHLEAQDIFTLNSF